jgi:hypothetical protein
MRRIPFSQTFVGAVIVAVIAGLIVLGVQMKWVESRDVGQQASNKPAPFGIQTWNGVSR